MRISILLLTLTLALFSSPGSSAAIQDQATSTPTGISSPVPTTSPEQGEEGASPDVLIAFPEAGQALQGQISIRGTIDVRDFQSAELSFAYANDPTGTWFMIESELELIDAGLLASWDTTTITDGQYNLRLNVTLNDGEQITTTVEDIRVRNYTPIETNTPVPTDTPEALERPTFTLTPTSTITVVPLTSTPMPTNPAQLTTRDITTGLGKGALGVAAFFMLMGLYGAIKRAFRR